MFHNNLVLGRVDKGVCLFTPYPPDLISGTQEISNFPVISCLPEKWWMRSLHPPYSKSISFTESGSCEPQSMVYNPLFTAS